MVGGNREHSRRVIVEATAVDFFAGFLLRGRSRKAKRFFAA